MDEEEIAEEIEPSENQAAASEGGEDGGSGESDDEGLLDIPN